MRDLFLFAALAVLVVKVLREPYIGALAWVVFGVMNPHRLAWGAAFNFPFALTIALLTLTGMILTRQWGTWKGGSATAVLILLLLWCCITTVFAVVPNEAADYLVRVTKIVFMTAVLLLLLNTKRHVLLLVWALALSLGFYGIKGGVFVLATGGNFHVNGPDGSVMEGNNSLAVGLVMIIPLLVFLHQQVVSKWIRLALLFAIAMCAMSVLGSYSRGALLAVLAMGLMLWVRGKQKILIAIGAVAFVLIAIPAMPEQWTARMNTIETYEEDVSAQGRLIGWETAYNIAKDRFPVGGGFEWQAPAQSARYSPDPTLVIVPHSIYFEVLGTQGFIGLGLYLLFWLLVWLQCSSLRRVSRGRSDLAWAFSLGSMVQVGLVGFAVGGAFLNLAFWDLPYYLFSAVATAGYVVNQQLATASHSEVQGRLATDGVKIIEQGIASDNANGRQAQ
jgi:putative inorganic carbon (hco3(-)) transporter